MLNRCHFGDCRDSLRQMAGAGLRVQCVVTSPPYFGLRDYGHPGQLGLEATLAEYLANQVQVFRLVRDVLADDGVLWLNMGDAYAGTTVSGSQIDSRRRDNAPIPRSARKQPGLKRKDLMGVPWRLAFALQDDGWYLRRDIIWHKPNPMPETVSDRCTTAHEYVFHLSKSPTYYYHADAIREPVTGNAHSSGSGVNPKAEMPTGWDGGPGDHKGLVGRYRNNGVGFGHGYDKQPKPRVKQNPSFCAAVAGVADIEDRNRRSVWTIPTQPYEGAHTATFPEALVAPCILAGSRPGDVVLDPYFGTGTVGQVAQRLNRQWVGCEINPEYAPLQAQRLAQLGLAL